jgi:cytoskeletal protein CcmA (bactofilin family)
MTNIIRGILVAGTVEAKEAVRVGGVVRGEVLAHENDVTIEEGGRIDGNITARIVTIKGTCVGRIIATRGLRLSSTAQVRAEVAAPSIAMEDGALFNGSVEPARIEAALRVAAYRRKA